MRRIYFQHGPTKQLLNKLATTAGIRVCWGGRVGGIEVIA